MNFWLKNIINESSGETNKDQNTKEDMIEELLVKRPSRGRISVFTSGKGGVGKSTLASAVAGFLSLNGNKVLLIDTDTGLRNIDVMLGIDYKVSSNLYDVLEGRTEWKEALLSREDMPNLYIIVSDQSREKESIRKDAFERFVLSAARYFDNVIIDCPAGIEYGFHLATGCVDEAFVVSFPEAPSLRGASQVVRLLEKRHVAPIVGILNRCVEKLEREGLSPSKEIAEEILGIPIRCKIPLDMVVMVCNDKGIPLATWNKPSAAIRAIKDFVENEILIERTNINRENFGSSLRKNIFLERGNKNPSKATEEESSQEDVEKNHKNNSIFSTYTDSTDLDETDDSKDDSKDSVILKPQEESEEQPGFTKIKVNMPQPTGEEKKRSINRQVKVEKSKVKNKISSVSKKMIDK